MSSNTLRGIGQEGGGDGAKPKADGPGTTAAGDAEQPAPDAAGGASAERPLDVRKLRSLDSTVPGTRSLDDSVPEARPSLDGKVPSLAATMLGMTAPGVPGPDAARPGAAGDRGKGTVQGRDVHLPVELQRRAGALPVAGAPESGPRAEAAPQAVDYSEPTIADPVRVEHGSPELNSHSPWYDQEPLGSHDYDDPKPSLIGRVAIGAAVAASLAVILFAIVRVRVQGAAQEAEAMQPPVAAPAPPPAPMETAPAAIPIPVPRDPADPGLFGGEQLPVDPPEDFATGTKRVDIAAAGVRGPSRTAQASGTPAARPAATSGAASTRPLGATSARAAAPSAGSGATGPRASASPEAPTTPPPVAAVNPSPGTISAPPAAVPTPVSGSPATSPNPDDLAPVDPTAKPGAPAKPKGKSYDPDSTLPLNLE